MNWLKNYLQDFPTHPATVATGLVLIFFFGMVIVVRLAMGLVMPSGYDNWMWALIAIAGVSTAGGIGKRLTDVQYVEAKAKGAPKVVTGGPTTVTTETPIPSQ